MASTERAAKSLPMNQPLEQRTRPHRVRVDGKFFARGGERIWLRGVTYGTFAPDAQGDAFPSPACVHEDFARARCHRTIEKSP